MGTKRRDFLKKTLALAGTAGLAGAAPGLMRAAYASSGEIHVGVLFSLTGGTSIVERSMSETCLMAIEEINAAGGLLGKQIIPHVEDPASDPKVFNEKARKLVLKDRVDCIFGCYTSSSRKAVLPVVEKRKNLLVYPIWYEGLECSKNILYGGAVPNQLLENGIPWGVNKMGRKKIFMVGTDYVFPRGMARITKQILEKTDAEWVADEYLPFGHTEWATIVKKIRDSGADMVVSSVVGNSVIAFHREFVNQGLSFDDITFLSTVTTEIEVAAMGVEYAEGSYITLPYFQTLDTPENKRFVDAYQARLGKDAMTHNGVEGVWNSVHLWEKAVQNAASSAPLEVIAGVQLNPPSVVGPQGLVKFDPVNLHVTQTPRIGRVRSDGMIEVVDEYPQAIGPLPYYGEGERYDNRMCTMSGAVI